MGLLQLVTDKIKALRQKHTGKQQFLNSLMDAVADGHLTAEEMTTLSTLTEQFGLSEEEMQAMKVSAYQRAYEAAKADGVVTREEEHSLQEIQRFFGLNDADVFRTQRDLARYCLIREIQLGNLPSTGVPGLVTQKAEVAYWVEPSELLEERVVSRGYVGGSSGVSFRIARGVSYRVGSSRGRLVSETAVVPVSRGDLVLTSKRIIFRGDAKNFTVRVPKIVDIQQYNDGFLISAETGKPKVVRFRNDANTEIVGAILSAIVNQAET